MALLYHSLADLCGVSVNLLKKKQQLVSILEKAARYAGFKIFAKSAFKFPDGGEGISATLIIGASHISIHTWPEFRYAAIDVASCTGKKAALTAIKFIINSLKPKKWKLSTLRRPFSATHKMNLPINIKSTTKV